MVFASSIQHRFWAYVIEDGSRELALTSDSNKSLYVVRRQYIRYQKNISRCFSHNQWITSNKTALKYHPLRFQVNSCNPLLRKERIILLLFNRFQSGVSSSRGKKVTGTASSGLDTGSHLYWQWSASSGVSHVNRSSSPLVTVCNNKKHAY